MRRTRSEPGPEPGANPERTRSEPGANPERTRSEPGPEPGANPDPNRTGPDPEASREVGPGSGPNPNSDPNSEASRTEPGPGQDRKRERVRTRTQTRTRTRTRTEPGSTDVSLQYRLVHYHHDDSLWNTGTWQTFSCTLLPAPASSASVAALTVIPGYGGGWTLGAAARLTGQISGTDHARVEIVLNNGIPKRVNAGTRFSYELPALTPGQSYTATVRVLAVRILNVYAVAIATGSVGHEGNEVGTGSQKFSDTTTENAKIVRRKMRCSRVTLFINTINYCVCEKSQIRFVAVTRRGILRLLSGGF